MQFTIKPGGRQNIIRAPKLLYLLAHPRWQQMDVVHLSCCTRTPECCTAAFHIQKLQHLEVSHFAWQSNNLMVSKEGVPDQATLMSKGNNQVTHIKRRKQQSCEIASGKLAVNVALSVIYMFAGGPKMAVALFCIKSRGMATCQKAFVVPS